MPIPSIKIDQTKLRESFDQHLASPEISTEQYVRSRQIALGQTVMTKQRVYLDKRYWIFMRDASMHRTSSESAHSLLASLRSRVKSNQTICPISESLFMELMKQTDLTTRKATAELIDELSNGVTLIPYPQRVATEIAHFIHSQAGLDVYPLETLVWTKLSYIFGIQHPVNDKLEPTEMRLLQKAFFDHMWECSLAEIVERLSDTPAPPFDYDALAKHLNILSSAHADEIKNFSQTYAAEIRGCLSLATSVAREVIEKIASGSSGKTIENTELEQQEHELELLKYFCDAIKRRNVAVALRTPHIGALCHAAVRWDKKRKLEGNDLFDFHHAEAAVGYCNVFLTEAALHTMLKQHHLKLADYFPCEVISSLEEAATHFKYK